MNNQMISPGNTDTPAEVVSKMAAIQAQDYEAALWAIGLRSRKGTTRDDVIESLRKGENVRTWLMRGTLHISSPKDTRWLIEPTRESLQRTAAKREENRGLSKSAVERCKATLLNALQGGRAITRSEAYGLFEAAGVPSNNNLGYHMLYRAAWDGLICFGPQKGKEQTFVLLEEWAPDHTTYPEEDILKELALRYFSGHGPATLEDFVWWTGIRMNEARKGIEMASSKLTRVEMNGSSYYTRGKEAVREGTLGRMFLLPGYDEYILGYRDRSMALGDISFRKIAHSNGVFLPVIVSGGRVVGTWKRQSKGKLIKILIQPFGRFGTHDLSKVNEAADDYRRFMGTDVKVVH